MTVFEIVLAPPARRALAEELPESVAGAVIEFMAGSLADRPTVVGKPLRGDLAGVWAARRGAYRVLYRVIDADNVVLVIRIEHRGTVYRPR